MFTYIHLTQEKGWHLVGEIITIHTNSFSEQQEQKGIISPNKRMTVTSLLHQLNAEDLIKDIIRKENQIETSNSTPLIKNLEMSDIFEDKNDKEGNSVTDKLIIEVSQLLELVQVIATHTMEL